jgi:hypothetical protein
MCSAYQETSAIRTPLTGVGQFSTCVIALIATVKNFRAGGESQQEPPGETILLLQLRVLRLGFFQDGDVGVGVFQCGLWSL